MNASPLHATFVRCAPAVFVFLWSTGYVGARYGLPYAEPLTFTAIRFAVVVTILAVIVRLSRARLPRSPRMWAHLAVSGVLIHACFIGGVFTAIDLGVDISIAAVITGTQPLLTAILVMPLLGEVLNGRQWAGFALGFVGLVMVVMKSFAVGTLPLAGFAACVLALVGITVGTLYQKRYVAGVDLLAGSAIQFGAALLPCIAWAAWFETGVIEWNLTVIVALAWLCVALSVGAISVLLFLIREGAASRVSGLFYLVPPVTALQGYWLFDETLSAVQLAGVAVTAAGVAMINAAPRAGAGTRAGTDGRSGA